LTILSKKSLSSEFSKAKSQREKKKKGTLGELWIKRQLENLEDIRYKLSIIY
jgi:hypothetical protein